MERHITAQRLATYLITIISLGFLLIYLKSFFAPLALALLFALMLYPAVKRLESWRVPRGLAIFSLLIAFLTTVAAVVFGISQAFRRFLRDLPNLEGQFQANIESFRLYIANKLSLGEQASNIVSEQLQLSQIIDGRAVGAIVGTTTSTIVIAGFTLVFTFFMLYYRDKFVAFLHSIFKKNRHKVIHEILDQMDDIAPRYLLGIVTVVSILAVINSTGFAIIGVESPVFMGIIAATLNIIPFIGTIFGFGIVFLFTLATQSLGVALGVLIMFVVVQFFDNNVLTPNITASKIKLNPLFAILAILLGNILWGVLGMFVALPFLAMIKIILDSTPRWKPLGDLLGTVKPVGDDTEK